MGLSTKPAGGYDKKTQGGNIAGVLDTLKIETAAFLAAGKLSVPVLALGGEKSFGTTMARKSSTGHGQCFAS
jgi:hypothetical protein